MKAARLGRTPAHDKGASHASMKSARRKSHGNFRTSVPQFPRAIRKNASAMLSAAAQLLLLIRVALPL